MSVFWALIEIMSWFWLAIQLIPVRGISHVRIVGFQLLSNVISLRGVVSFDI